MNTLISFYPFFLSLFPLLFFYNHNAHELTLSVLWIPMVFIVIGTGLVWYICRIVLRDTLIAALFTAFLSVIFFSHARFVFVVSLFGRIIPAIEPVAEQLTILGYIFVVGIFMIHHYKRRSFKAVASFVSVTSVILFLVSLMNLGYLEVQRAYVSSHRNVVPDKQDVRSNDASVSHPDIYYFIFDRYARNDVLSEYYDYDNTPFTGSLEKKGFVIADKSHANYLRTLISMDSALNMSYLQDFDIPYDTVAVRHDALIALYKNNRVMEYLREKNYRIIFSGDSRDSMAYNERADENYNLYNDKTHFIIRFLTTTAVDSFSKKFLSGAPNLIIFPEKKLRENREYKFDSMKKVADKAVESDQPYFVHMHMLLPHDPYLYDADCNHMFKTWYQGTQEDYIAQLECTNTFILDMVDHILKAYEQEDQKPVIIIQSDEGPYTKAYYETTAVEDWNTIADEGYETHGRILNAYYLPDSEADIPMNITPVNTFRFIFNEYFGDSFEMLPNEAYLVPDQVPSREYTNVTAKVVGEE